MSEFVYDVICSRDDICNLEQESKNLLKGALTGKNMVVLGRRNTGKTSLVRSVLIPDFRKKQSERQKESFVFFCDLMGVRNLGQISRRIAAAFETSFTDSFPVKSMFLDLFESLKALKPRAELDAKTGNLNLGIGIGRSETEKKAFTEILANIANIHRKGVPSFIILDEFQDIHFVEEAEALFRDSLQNLPATIPVILMGSKKHLLSKIFSIADAPFYGWGQDIEISEIEYETYRSYMNARFQKKGLYIASNEAKTIQELCDRIPEPINIVCQGIIESLTESEVTEPLVENIPITENDIYMAFENVVKQRSSRFEEFLSHFTTMEEEVITTIAFHGPIRSPQGKEFLGKVNISAKGVAKIFQRLEDDTVIYRSSKGFIIADPLLARHIKRSR